MHFMWAQVSAHLVAFIRCVILALYLPSLGVGAFRCQGRTGALRRATPLSHVRLSPSSLFAAFEAPKHYAETLPPLLPDHVQQLRQLRAEVRDKCSFFLTPLDQWSERSTEGLEVSYLIVNLCPTNHIAYWANATPNRSSALRGASAPHRNERPCLSDLRLAFRRPSYRARKVIRFRSL
jgi:hypothetical protein